MKQKFTTVSAELFDYVCAHSSGNASPLLDELRAETEMLGEVSEMLIGKDQGSFMSILVRSMAAKAGIEVGTFTGYSSTCIAFGLPDDGRLVCVDESAEWTRIAQRYWKRAGVDTRIELRLGDAKAVLERLSSDETFDFAFIDADKPRYETYYELILPHIRPNGLLLFDNMLRNGKVMRPPQDDENALAISALNDKLANDPRIDSVLLTIGDGITLCRKK